MRNRTNRVGDAGPSRHRGLTLVELLVAISVLGFVAVLGWRGLDSIVRARIALTSELEQTRGMQLAFAQLQSDCEHLASPSIMPDRVPLAAGPRTVSTWYAQCLPTTSRRACKWSPIGSMTAC